MVWTADQLREFEADIAAEFEAGNIRAPVHLGNGNEDQLISYFAEHFRPGDWCFGTWRAHLHALLAGVPPEKLRAAIMDGRSIALGFPEHRFLCSAIVAGAVPIALGAALAVKLTIDARAEQLRPQLEREGKAGFLHNSPRVHCFVGDMGAMTGAFAEAVRYSNVHGLPVNWIIEDNGMSVKTPTTDVWGDSLWVEHFYPNVYYYRYKLGWPHQGTGQYVSF